MTDLPFDHYLAIVQLQARCANALDDDRLDDWLDCFDEAASYRVLSRENMVRNLPLALMQLDNKDMMRDRVLSLRQANVTNIHRDQHVVGPVEITRIEPDAVSVVAGFAVYQTDPSGRSALFAVGSYRDDVSLQAGRARLRSRDVVMDTFAVPNMLSTPL